MRVTGGTLTAKQPTIGSMMQLKSLLAEMGISIDYNVINHGLFPCIVGTVEVKIKSIAPGERIHAIDLTSEARLAGESVTPIIDLTVYTT